MIVPRFCSSRAVCTLCSYALGLTHAILQSVTCLRFPPYCEIDLLLLAHRNLVRDTHKVPCDNLQPCLAPENLATSISTAPQPLTTFWRLVLTRTLNPHSATRKIYIHGVIGPHRTPHGTPNVQIRGHNNDFAAAVSVYLQIYPPGAWLFFRSRTPLGSNHPTD